MSHYQDSGSPVDAENIDRECHAQNRKDSHRAQSRNPRPHIKTNQEGKYHCNTGNSNCRKQKLPAIITRGNIL